MKKIKQCTLVMGAISLLLLTSLRAQVTIGSTQAPIGGALLELTEGTVTKKGLGLPRVQLTEMNKLIMGSTAFPQSVYLDHQGLVVYNVSGIKDNACAHIPNGIFVWDGANWGSMTSINFSNNVSQALDQDGNIFYYRLFGTAGTWMLQNMRARKFDPRRNIDNGFILQELIGPKRDISASAPYWAYPANNNEPSPTNANVFDDNRRLGLLYSWAAATNSKGGLSGDDVLQNEGGVGYDGRFVREQGICPYGWYLPSDKEWTDLENEIITNPSQYSSLTSILGGLLNFETGATATSTRGTNHGQAMRSHCYDPNPSTSPTYGQSLSLAQGGFSTLLSGQIASGNAINYTQNEKYWSSSAMGQTSAWIRSLPYNINGVVRDKSLNSQMQTVRCKKVDCKTWTDLSSTNLTTRTVTDHEGNAYPIESFGGAGWWMTQNMRTQSMPDECYGAINIAYSPRQTSFSTPHYVYPDDVNLTGNPVAGHDVQKEGLMYNWAATTYGKGGVDGRSNVDNQAIDGDSEEGNDPNERKRRGICPKGWHLPSDYEWNQLEQEIITNYTSYSTGATQPSPWVSTWGNNTPLSRGTHGAIMKSNSTLTNSTGPIAAGGHSNSGSAAGNRGFDAILVGYGYIDNVTIDANIDVQQYGLRASFWTTSATGAGSNLGKGSAAWNRYLGSGSAANYMRKTSSHRGLLMSVRCKKD